MAGISFEQNVLDELLAQDDSLRFFSESDLVRLGFDDAALSSLRADPFQLYSSRPGNKLSPHRSGNQLPSSESGSYLGPLVANFLFRYDLDTKIGVKKSIDHDTISGHGTVNPAVVGDYASGNGLYVSAFLFAEAISVGLSELMRVRQGSRPLVVTRTEDNIPDLYISVGDLHFFVDSGTGLDTKTQLAIEYSRTRNPLIREKLISMSLEWAKSLGANIAVKSNLFNDLEDYVSAAVVGLLNAINKFSPEAANGASFETYSNYRIRGEVFDLQRSSDFLSRGERRFVREITGLSNTFVRNHGRAPDYDELLFAYKSSGGDEDLFRELYNSEIFSIEIISLEDVITWDRNGAPLHVSDVVYDPNPRNSDPVFSFMREELLSCFYEELNEVEPEHKHIIEMYVFGRMTHKEISEEIGKSDARVSQICSQYFSSPKYFKRTRDYLGIPFVVELKL